MSREIEYRIERYEVARRAMKRVAKRAALTFHDWLDIGGGVLEARLEALAVPGVGNRDDTLAFRREFGEILKREHLHDEDNNGGPDKVTRAFLLKIMACEGAVVGWWNALPRSDKMNWNSPKVVWEHFDKKTSKAKLEKAGKVGLTAAEEKEAVESAQIKAIQARDAKIESLRETIRELHLDIDRLNAEVARLKALVGVPSA